MLPSLGVVCGTIVVDFFSIAFQLSRKPFPVFWLSVWKCMKISLADEVKGLGNEVPQYLPKFIPSLPPSFIWRKSYLQLLSESTWNTVNVTWTILLLSTLMLQ